MNRFTVFLPALLAATPLVAGEATVIRNATVITVTKGTFQGSILIRDGKIVEAGEKVLIPDGARVIDAGGQFVMPGIIDCHSHIAADSINEGAVAVSSMVGIEDVINPDDIDIYRAVSYTHLVNTEMSPAKIPAVPFPWCTSQSTTMARWMRPSRCMARMATAMSLIAQKPSPCPANA